MWVVRVCTYYGHYVSALLGFRTKINVYKLVNISIYLFISFAETNILIQ